MAFTTTLKPAVGQEVMLCNLAGQRPEAVEERRGMALGKNQPVVVRMAGLVQVIAKAAAEKSVQAMGTRTRMEVVFLIVPTPGGRIYWVRR